MLISTSHEKRHTVNNKSLILVLGLILCNLPVLNAQDGMLCTGTLDVELFPEGNFGSGSDTILADDPNFSSRLLYDAINPPPDDGYYVLANNTSSWGEFAGAYWIKATDNSDDPEGYMMIVNSTFDPGIIFEHTLSTCPNTRFEISVDVLNLMGPDEALSLPPNLEFLINNKVEYTVPFVPQNGEWTTHRFSFISLPSSPTLRFEIRNLQEGGFGNDLAFDNISVRRCVPELSILGTSCSDENYTLQAVISDSPYTNPAYQWQTSLDGGNNWINIPVGNGPILDLGVPVIGRQYRVIVAPDENSLSETACRIVSPVETISNTETVLETEIEAQICAGTSYSFGGSTLSAAGTYRDTVTASTGCDSILILTLQVQDTIFGDETIRLCPDTPFQGQVWPENSVVFSDLLSSSNGCDSITRYLIQYESTPLPEITGDPFWCLGETISLEVNGSYTTFNWEDGSNSPTLQVNSPGTYTVQVTDENGCSGEDSFVIEETSISAQLDFIDPGCPGDATGTILVLQTQGGSAPFRYQLNSEPEQASPLFDNLSAGDYEISVIDSDNCAISLSAALFDPLERTISLTTENSIALGDRTPLILNIDFAPSSVSWTPVEHLSCDSCLNPIAQPITNTLYEVQVVDGNGCIFRASSLIQVQTNQESEIYVPNAFSPNNDGINDFFTIFGKQTIDTIEEMLIFDRWGNQLFLGEDIPPNNFSKGWNGKRGNEEMPIGVYTYFANVRLIDGSTQQVSGAVHLLR